MAKIYLPVDDVGVRSLFQQHGHTATDNPNEPDIQAHIFVGGEDICPFLYGESLHKTSTTNFIRDMQEINYFKSLAANDLKIGICRGAQFLNVMSGGTLWQDVDQHGKSHIMQVRDGIKVTEEFIVTSTHHQMMIPFPDYAEVIGVAKECTYKDGPDIRMSYSPDHKDREWDDIEVVYYWHTNSFCCQFHPEYDPRSRMTEWFMAEFAYLVGEKKRPVKA